MQFLQGKKQTNKQKIHKSLFESLSKNTWKYMDLSTLTNYERRQVLFLHGCEATRRITCLIHSNFDGCHLKILFLHVICQVFLAVLLCKILESQWVFKSFHRYHYHVLIFHSSSPGESVRALTVLIDVWHVNSRSPLSFPVCFNKIKPGSF